MAVKVRSKESSINFQSSLNFSEKINHDQCGHKNAQEIEMELTLESFPSPSELWEMYKKYKHLETPEQENIATFDYFFDGSGRAPRYYQQIAINRSVEAI